MALGSSSWDSCHSVVMTVTPGLDFERIGDRPRAGRLPDEKRQTPPLRGPHHGGCGVSLWVPPTARTLSVRCDPTQLAPPPPSLQQVRAIGRKRKCGFERGRHTGVRGRVGHDDGKLLTLNGHASFPGGASSGIESKSEAVREFGADGFGLPHDPAGEFGTNGGGGHRNSHGVWHPKYAMSRSVLSPDRSEGPLFHKKAAGRSVHCVPTCGVTGLRCLLSEGCRMTGRGVHDLLRDFALAKKNTDHHKLPKKQQKRLADYHAMVLQRQHVLLSDPGQLWTVASSRPAESAPREDTKNATGPADRAWLRAKHPLPEVKWAFTIETECRITAVASYTAGGRSMLLVASGREVHQFDALTGENVKLRLALHTRPVTSLCLLPNEQLVTGTSDNIVGLWDTDTGQCIRSLAGHTGGMRALCALPDGRLVTGSWDSTAKVWDTDTGQCLLTLTGHTQGINGLCLLPDGRLATGSWDSTVRLWDTDTGECIHTLTGPKGRIRALCALPDGRLVTGSWHDSRDHIWWIHTKDDIATPDSNNVVRVWNTDTGQCIRTLAGHTREIRAMCALPDGRFATGSEDRTVKVWDVGDQEVNPPLTEPVGVIRAMCALPDGRLATVSWDNIFWDHPWRGPQDALAPPWSWNNKVRVWDTDTGQCLRTLTGHTLEIRAMCALPDGRLVTGSWDGTARIWDTHTGQCIHTFAEHTHGINGLCLLPDGRLVTGSWDSTAKVWDTATGQCLLTLTGHTQGINGLCLLPDGRLVTGSRDNTVGVWNTDTGQCIHILTGHKGSILTLCVLPDGRTVTGAVDEPARVWDTDTG